MNKPESVREDETHNILWDFHIQMDHPISTRKDQTLWLSKKEALPNNEERWVKIKENKKKKKRGK